MLAPSLRSRYHLTLTEVGVLLAAPIVGSIPSLYPWGMAADRFGERVAVTTGLGAAAICLAGAAFVPSFAGLVVLLFWFANRQDDRENLWGVFAQDDFKVTPSLTLNLGLRWSFFDALYNKEYNQDVMFFGGGPNPLDGLHIRIGGNLYTPQKTNFGPAVGFAWSPNRWPEP